MALVLIADHDTLLSEALQRQYQRQGHQTLVANTSHDAVRLAEQYFPDLVVLNASLPYHGCAEVHQRLKATPRLSDTPIISYALHLQLAEEPRSAVGGRQAWQPASLRELALNTTAVLNREASAPSPASTEHLIAGPLVLHARNLTVEVDGRVAHLTRTEFELLRYLMLHLDEACSSRRLLQTVWGYPPGTGSTDVVRAHVRNLRNKIEQEPDAPVHLRTLRNCGYVLCSNGHDEDQEAEATPQPRAEKLLHYAPAVLSLETT